MSTQPPNEPTSNVYSAAAQPYLSYISALCPRYPNLYLLSSLLKNADPTIDGRAIVLEFYHEPGLYVRRVDFQDGAQLKSYLEEAEAIAATYELAIRNPDQYPGVAESFMNDPCRLYILEDMIPEYVDLLGSYLGIDPFLFANQMNTANWYGSVEYGNVPKLPSSLPKDATSFTLLYYQILLFEGEIKHREMFCKSNVYRKIHLKNKDLLSRPLDRSGLAHKNASFWSRKRIYGGWNAVMLVDPPVGDDLITGAFPYERAFFSQPSRPFQKGYLDFTPYDFCVSPLFHRNFPTEDLRGPPRGSILDDIAFYWTNRATYAQIRKAIDVPSESTYFLKRIIASQWVLVIEYLKQTISVLELAMESQSQNSLTMDSPLSQLEQQLGETHTWRRRCAQYCEQMEANLMHLGINKSKEEGDDDDSQDFLYILGRLINWKGRAEALVSVLMGQLAIVEGQRSFGETRSVSRLTVLGLLFVPLSLTSGILSMGGEYLPGNRYFWVFFAAGIPLVIAVFLVAFGVQFFSTIRQAIIPERKLEKAHQNLSGTENLQRIANPYEYSRRPPGTVGAKLHIDRPFFARRQGNTQSYDSHYGPFIPDVNGPSTQNIVRHDFASSTSVHPAHTKYSSAVAPSEGSFNQTGTSSVLDSLTPYRAVPFQRPSSLHTPCPLRLRQQTSSTNPSPPSNPSPPPTLYVDPCRPLPTTSGRIHAIR